MPEGPVIIMLKQQMQPFKNKKVIAATGYAKNLQPEMLTGKTLKDVKSWGKHLLLCFPKFTLRVHLGLFGSYRINSRGKRNASLGMTFVNGDVNFYISTVALIEKPLDEVYDWQADIMSDQWSSDAAVKKLKAKPGVFIGDALLDQQLFAGSGNIIRNEVMFRCRVHPESKIGDIPDKKLLEIADETANYASDFLKWRKKDELSKHFEAYEQKMCPRDHIPFHKDDLGKTKRIPIIVMYARYCMKNDFLHQRFRYFLKAFFTRQVGG
jgi:endonuclease-8